MFGISAALTTPFLSDGSVDFNRLNSHIKTVLSGGCTSVTLFGTTGEGPSVASAMRLETVQAVAAANIDPAKLVLTLHGGAVTDIVNQATAAQKTGVQRFLLPPPCYFNEVTDAGLFDWFAGVLSQFAGTRAQFILYHIPQVIGVGLPVPLVKQLKAAFPDAVFGVKDSSGSFENTEKLLALPGLEILVGDERQLAACARIGASGAISGIANLFPGRLAQVHANGVNDSRINDLVDMVLRFPVTPAIKALVAHKYQTEEWRKTAAPLIDIPDADYATLCAAYDLAGRSGK